MEKIDKAAFLFAYGMEYMREEDVIESIILQLIFVATLSAAFILIF